MIAESITQFETLSDTVRRQLLDAQMSFDIWESLWPTEEHVDILNAFKGFFVPTRSAHLDRFFIKMFNATDRKHKTAPSVYRLLDAAESEPTLTPGLDTGSVRARLDGQRELLGRVARYRHKRAAHWDTEGLPEPVYLNEVRGLLNETETIFNDVYGAAHPGEMWFFETVQASDPEHLLRSLERFHEVIPAAGVVAWTARPDPANPALSIVDSDALEKLRASLS